MRVAILPLLTLFVSPAALAQIERQHGSHEHGRADLQLAYADGRLELELTAPGSDIVGFEHVPADVVQQQAIDRALAILGDGANWLRIDPAQACAFTEANAHTHGFKAGAAHADHDHDHGHHHEDGEDGHDEDGHDSHGEFHVALKADCATAPASIHVDLVRHFPGAARIRVEFLNEDHQGRGELEGGKGVVVLKP